MPELKKEEVVSVTFNTGRTLNIDPLDISLLKNVLSMFEKKYDLTADQIISVMGVQLDAESIPVSIFANKKLSVFEAIVKFLAENKDLEIKQIAEVLGKGYNSTWVTYNNAKKKMPDHLKVEPGKTIPISAFNLQLTIFESVVRYMREDLKMSNKKVADLLNRDNKTTWSIYSKALKKLKKS
ncbi:hypothetical protein ACFL0W_06305 [Nanoarchaeota archaeon]